MAEEFIELHGDRLYGDDAAVVAGLARIDGRRMVVVGHQKGADTEENIRRNFGMPHPEGYRKGMRAMELAERFRLPLLTIARSVGVMSRLRTPIVTMITGEGGSGGALAIAVGDVVIALENAVYSVISPEGCASILWRTSDKAQTAALAMRMTAADQAALGVVDRVVDEPGAGAHTDHAEMARRLRPILLEELGRLEAIPLDDLLELRYRRYRSMGPYTEVVGALPIHPERSTLSGRIQDLIEAGRRTIGDALPPLPSGGWPIGGPSKGGTTTRREDAVRRAEATRPLHGAPDAAASREGDPARRDLGQD
jgi:acetyl-CoA carboxylase alpha subunit